jgi:hypothetical protein
MIDRSKLSELYPKVKIQSNTNRVKSDNISVNVIFGHALIIAMQLALVVAMFIVMVNYFIQIINTFNIINLLPMITILLLAWVVFLVVILASVSNRLQKTVVSNSMFLVVYLLCVAPVAQLIFNLYRHFNHGLVDILPFVGLLFVENLTFVPTILLIMNNEKVSTKSKTTWLIILIIFCAFITYINGII